MLIAFEGLDQSGKETQTSIFQNNLFRRIHRSSRIFSFPNYATPIGHLIAQANDPNNKIKYPQNLRQLLYAANKLEFLPEIQRCLAEGELVICDRWIWSGIVYGIAFDLSLASEGRWLLDIQKHIPSADLTIYLDIDARTSFSRKISNRDSYEGDLDRLNQVRDQYQFAARANGWKMVDGNQSIDAVAKDVWKAFEAGLPQFKA